MHAYGGKVIGTTALVKHALRSEQLGADAVIITGYEAAAHAGNVGNIVLIPQTVDKVKVPCIAAGGFTDGKSLAAALALGAEGIAMGTRLTATLESEVPENVKQVWLNCTEEDTIIDDAFDGINCRVWHNKAAEQMVKQKGFPLFSSISAALAMKKEMNLSFGQLISTALNLKKQEVGLGSGTRTLGSVMRFAVGTRLISKAILEGDTEKGILLMGQSVGRIHDLPTVQEVIDNTIAEARQVLAKMERQIND